MIADVAKVSMSDGTFIQAIELFPGRQGLMAFNVQRLPVNGRVLDRKIETKNDVVALILSNGETLCGSRDQRVATMKDKRVYFKEMADVEIGTRLRGQIAGMPTSVMVVGTMFYPKKDIRLVELMLDHNKMFVVDGILCK